MAVEKSEVNEQEEGQKGSQKYNDELIRSLQKELEAIKKNQSSVGMSPVEVAKLVKELTAEHKTDQEKYGDGESHYVDEKDIDPEDFLEIPVPFFCHKVGYVIVDDKRKGHIVRAPRGKIVFKYDSTKRKQVGKEYELYNLSVYNSYSKTESEWLKEHSRYGSIFFDKINAAMGADARKAAKIAKFMNVLSNMEQHRLIRVAKSWQVPIIEDLNGMRIEIAYKQAQQEIEKEEAANLSRAEEAVKETLLLTEKP